MALVCKALGFDLKWAILSFIWSQELQGQMLFFFCQLSLFSLTCQVSTWKELKAPLSVTQLVQENPHSHVVFWPSPWLWGGRRLFPGSALCVYYSDDGSSKLPWITGHAGFGYAPGAGKLSTFLSNSPRDAVWDSQAEPPHWGESRGMKWRMCQALHLNANWEWPKSGGLLEEKAGGLWKGGQDGGVGHCTAQEAFGGVISQAHVKYGLRALLGRVCHFTWSYHMAVLVSRAPCIANKEHLSGNHVYK